MIEFLQSTFFKPSIWASYGPRLIDGLFVTIQLVGLSFVIGFILSIGIALLRVSKNRFLSALGRGYIYFFRGSPLLVQLFLFYYGLGGSFPDFWRSVGLWWFFGNAWYCCVFIFALNTAAYQAEIFRGSLLSVPKGQFEACDALSLSSATAFIKVILPQAFILAIRPLGNEFILMIKASAIASLVTVYDVMGVTKLAFSRTYNFQVYLWAAVLYLCIVEITRRIINFLEYRLTRHLKR